MGSGVRRIQVGLWLSVWLIARPCLAQEPRSAAFVQLASESGVSGELAAAASRVARAKLAAVEGIQLSGSPALQLEDLQLAVGCVAENDVCMEAIAEQLEVDEIVYGSLGRVEDMVVVSLSRFQRGSEGMKVAVRSVPRDQSSVLVLDVVDAMVAELYGLIPTDPDEGSELPKVPTQPAGEPKQPAMSGAGAPFPGDESTSDFPVLAVLVGGCGVLALGAGAVLGIMAKSSEDEYASHPTTTRAEVDAALQTFSSAEDQATAANILIIGGASLLAGGVVLFILDGIEGDPGGESQAIRLSPYLSSTSGGFVVAGSFGKSAAQ